MSINQFKQTINKFATGVTVVTAYHNAPFGLTVNSFTSVSLEPKLILFNLDKKISSLDAFFKTDYFNINILSNKQKNIASIFAQKDIDRFSKVNYHISKNYVPILSNIHGVIECKKYKIMEAGDHYLFICRVVNTMVDETKEPLIFYNSKFCNIGVDEE